MALLGQYLPSWFTVPRQGRTYTYVRRTGRGGASGGLQSMPAWLRLLIFLILGGFASMVINGVERSLFEKNIFLPIIEKNTVAVQKGQSLTDSTLDGKLVHINAPDLVAPDTPMDHLFKIGGFPRSLRLKRKTEFCEWREFSTENCHKEGTGDNEREVCQRAYYYLKDWYPYQQTSLLYDQPVGHNNPSRPELMALLRESGGDAYNGGATFNAPNVYAVHGGSPQDELVQLDQRLVSTMDWFRQRANPTPAMLQTFDKESPVAAKQGEKLTESNPRFRYVGSGYFLSPYSPDTVWKVLRGLGMAWDGTLLDFQVADLFSKCEAGDVRVSFDVLEAAPVSFIGKLGHTTSAVGAVEAHITAISPSHLQLLHPAAAGLIHSNEPIVILQRGQFSPSKLIDSELSTAKWWSRGAQFVVAALLVLHGRVVMPSGSPWLPFIAAVAAYTYIMFSGLGWIYWTVGTGSRGQWAGWMLLLAGFGLWMERAAPIVREKVFEGMPAPEIQMVDVGKFE